MNFTSFKTELEALSFGKKSNDAILIYAQDFDELKSNGSQLVNTLKNKLKVDPSFNVLKLHLDQYKICFQKYQNFKDHAVPKLLEAIHINLANGSVQKLSYSKSLNPTILLQKELTLSPKNSLFKDFSQFTESLLSHKINIALDHIKHQKVWDLIVSVANIKIDQHEITLLPEPQHTKPTGTRQINYQHRDAILNYGFSKSLLCLFENSLIQDKITIMDYHCGNEYDLQGLQILGLKSYGWDPKTKPKGSRKKADIVHLGDTLSNIEDPILRSKTLQTAYKYCKSIFVVSCDVQSTSSASRLQAYGDGVITQDSNFKKFYTQNDFKQFIEDTLGTCYVIAAGIGIFYVLKNKEMHQDILKKACIRSISNFSHDFSKINYSQDLKDLLTLTNQLGRPPLVSEFSKLEETIKEVGSAEQVQRIYKAEVGELSFDKAYDIKRKDLLVYLAVANFNQRLPKDEIDESIINDIEYFLDEYDVAHQQALSLLYSVADPQVISTLCTQSEIGFKDEKSLYVRMDQHDQLHPVLRIYVGCCERLLGNISDFDLIKIHKESSKLSLMKYSDFYNDLLPKLELRVKVNLAYQKVKVFDYAEIKHPQLLFHKVRFFDERWESFDLLKKHSDKLTELDICIEDHGPNFTDFQETLKVHGYENESEFNSSI
ncbi:MAG: DNA phosphorothioation-associated putative methyltransferase [Candidatus Cloacimonetes bacterium]|nr:DNA phosphorothioation-associated putative methyltransferase [Candidatus Cloacimonadota bacterium]